MTVTNTQIRALRFRIKNGATANLTNLDTTIIDFFLNGTCAGKTLDNLPSTRGPGGACAPPLDLSAKKSGPVQLNCGVNNVYTVNLNSVAVQGYGFASQSGDSITITDATTDIVETNTFGNSGVTIDSAFDAMNRATRVQAAELSSVDQSTATINNADMSCANLGFFLAGFTNMTQTPQITVKNCKFPLPSPNSATAEAVAGDIWFIDGANANQVCQQPSTNRCPDTGTGRVCRCFRDPFTGVRTVQTVCKAPGRLACPAEVCPP